MPFPVVPQDAVDGQVAITLMELHIIPDLKGPYLAVI